MKKGRIRTIVRYGETDQMGVVYHGNYLVYFDMGRTSLMRELGCPYSEMEKGGSVLAVTEVHCRYVAPARFEEEIEITTTLEAVTGVRVKFSYEIHNMQDSRLLAQGYTVLGCLGKNGKPKKTDQ